MDEIYVGVDLGGTAIKFGVGGRDGELLNERSIPTEAHRGPDEVIGRMIEAINELLENIDLPLVGMGVGVPGLVDIMTGTTRFLPNLPGHWNQIPLGERLHDRFGCPVLVANDARAATLGELRYGYGRQRPNLTMAFFTLGTGIGGGVAIEGRLRMGSWGSAGELGHQTIDPSGLPCGCGSQGCLETLASGPALLGAAVRLMKSGQAPVLHERTEGKLENVTLENLKQVLDAEPSIRDAIRRAARAIGIAASNVVTTIDPDLIVLGGGVAELGPILTETIREEITDRVRMFPIDRLEVKRSRLGPAAGVLGAIGLGQMARERHSLAD